MTPLFRDPFFQPFLPPLEQMRPQRQMADLLLPEIALERRERC